jgi:hypothetical protein
MKRLLLLLLFLPLLSHAQDKLEEHWYSLALDGITVGFFHHTTWQDAEGLIRSEIEQSMEIRRFGVPFSMTQTDVWIEEEAGVLVSVSSELDMNGQRQRVEAEAVGGDLLVRIRRAGAEEEILLTGEEGPRGLYAAGREVSAVIGGTTAAEELAYRLFSPESLKIEEFRLRVLGPGELVDSLGRRHLGVLVEERTTSLPGIVTTEVYDGEARFLYSKTPVGLELEILRLEGDPRANQERGPEADPGAEVAAVFDVASLTVDVKGLDALSLEDTAAVTVRFRGPGVEILHEAARSAEEELSAPEGTGNQDPPLRVTSAEADARGNVRELVLELSSSLEWDGWFVSGSEPIPPETERYLEGGFHLELTDPRLEQLLERCRSAGIDGRTAEGSSTGDVSVLCLERLVNRFIVKKSLTLAFAGLGEILTEREGDCTEHALLMVALLRRAGVPSRLAYGLILTESGFIGHAWVEAYGVGGWHWLDPSFPEGQPYGLKLRLGVMDPAEPVWATISLALLQVAGTVEAEILETLQR